MTGKRERITRVCAEAIYESSHIKQAGMGKEAEGEWDWGNLKDSISEFWTNTAQPYLQENRGQLTRAGVGGLGGYALSKLLGMRGLGSGAMALGGAGIGYGSDAIRKWLTPYLGEGETAPQDIKFNANDQSIDDLYQELEDNVYESNESSNMKEQDYSSLRNAIKNYYTAKGKVHSLAEPPMDKKIERGFDNLGNNPREAVKGLLGR